MKDVNLAYKRVMKTIDFLKKEGIETIIQIPKVIRESKNPDELEIVKKYDKPDRLHYGDWRNVQFKVKSPLEAWKVSFAKRNLWDNGCSFDSGSGCGSMDWEIDWSFHLTDIEEEKDFKNFN